MHAHHADFRPLHYGTYALTEQTQPVQSLPNSLISGHYYGYFDVNCGYRTDEFGRSVSTQLVRNYSRPLPLGLDVDVSMLQNQTTSTSTSASVSNSPPDLASFYELGKESHFESGRAPSPNLPWLSKKISSDARTNARYRIVYNEKQKMELEKEFRFHQYISTQRKKQLAEELNLSERQVKVWFQNRRSKDRKDRYQLAALKGCVANCLVDNLSVMRCPHCQECSANCAASKETPALN